MDQIGVLAIGIELRAWHIALAAAVGFLLAALRLWVAHRPTIRWTRVRPLVLALIVTGLANLALALPLSAWRGKAGLAPISEPGSASRDLMSLEAGRPINDLPPSVLHRASVKGHRDMVAAYVERFGELPSSVASLPADLGRFTLTNPDDPDGPSVVIETLIDAWHREFRVTDAGIMSAGPDGKFGTDDDPPIHPLALPPRPSVLPED